MGTVLAAKEEEQSMKKRSAPVVCSLPTREQITKRAHEIFLERGSRPGQELDDWLQAEYELMQLPVRKIAELNPPTPTQGAKQTLVGLVHAAMVVGASSLTQFNR
jgi:hypothetical protein